MKLKYVYYSTHFNKRTISKTFLSNTFSLFLSLLLFLVTFTVTVQASSGSFEQGPLKAKLTGQGKVRIAIPTPTSNAVQVRKNTGISQNKQTNKWQIQSKSLSKKLLSGLERNSGILLGASALSYFVTKGLISLVSQHIHGKAKKHEIGLPPDFPEVPPPPGK